MEHMNNEQQPSDPEKRPERAAVIRNFARKIIEYFAFYDAKPRPNRRAPYECAAESNIPQDDAGFAQPPLGVEDELRAYDEMLGNAKKFALPMSGYDKADLQWLHRGKKTAGDIVMLIDSSRNRFEPPATGESDNGGRE